MSTYACESQYFLLRLNRFNHLFICIVGLNELDINTTAWVPPRLQALSPTVCPHQLWPQRLSSRFVVRPPARAVAVGGSICASQGRCGKMSLLPGTHIQTSATSFCGTAWLPAPGLSLPLVLSLHQAMHNSAADKHPDLLNPEFNNKPVPRIHVRGPGRAGLQLLRAHLQMFSH